MFIFLGREGGGAKRNPEGNAEGKRFKENSVSLTYNIFQKKKLIRWIVIYLLDSIIHPWNN